MEPFKLLTRGVLLILADSFNCTDTQFTLAINVTKPKEVSLDKMKKKNILKVSVYHIFVRFFPLYLTVILYPSDLSVLLHKQSGVAG